MIPRGSPFPSGPPLVLCCPACLLKDPASPETLSASIVFALGPSEQQDRMDVPFYRYRCAVPGCGYVEVHLNLLRERP